MRILIIIIFTVNLFSQKQILFAPELYIHVVNAEPNSTHYFNMELISKSYCFNSYYVPNEIIYECSECGNACDDCFAGNEIVITNNQGNQQGQNGFGFCAFGTSTREPHFGYGLYKFTYINNGLIFYIDFRDDRYTREWVNGGLSC